MLARRREFAAASEVSTVLCPTFALLNPFQCLPTFKRASNDTFDADFDADQPLPDLPHVVNPTTLPPSVLLTGEKLRGLRQRMKDLGIAVYIVPSEDEHQSENVALADKRREWLSGFTGSAGLCVVTLDDPETLSGSAILSTDGRYFLQAERQLDASYWRLLRQGEANERTWGQFAIDSAVSARGSHVISVDPRLISVAVGEYFERAQRFQYNGRFTFEPRLESNLVDDVWGEERPGRSQAQVYPLELKYAGEHTNEKVARVRHVLQEKFDCTHLVITALDDIAWLFNLRLDDDIAFTPVFFSYAIVTLDAVFLYVDPAKVGSISVREHLSAVSGLLVQPYTQFYPDIASLRLTVDLPNLRIALPRKSVATHALVASIPQLVARQTLVYDSVVSNLKVFKNPTELFNAKIAQYKDLLAFIEYLAWLEHQLLVKKRRVTEYDGACKIYAIRTNLPNFKGLSYETISSTGANASIIHYAPTKEENSVIDASKVYLLDSGAQYLEGTTDITRTYKFGTEGLTPEYKKYYTLVLKGHLAVAMAKFPPGLGSTATVLDLYARQALWNEGLDFNHGTGHGVGSFGNVHEAPLYIPSSSSTLQEFFRKGGIVTDEPGFYIDGECGFRVESELEIIECDDSVGKTRSGNNFLAFAYLTKVPFCRLLIDTKYLSLVEIEWINEYHRSVRADFAEKLLEIGDRRAHSWLLRETEPLGA